MKCASEVIYPKSIIYDMLKITGHSNKWNILTGSEKPMTDPKTNIHELLKLTSHSNKWNILTGSEPPMTDPKQIYMNCWN